MEKGGFWSVHAQSPRQGECCAGLGRRAVSRGACVSPVRSTYRVRPAPARLRAENLKTRSSAQRSSADCDGPVTSKATPFQSRTSHCPSDCGNGSSAIPASASSRAIFSMALAHEPFRVVGLLPFGGTTDILHRWLRLGVTRRGLGMPPPPQEGHWNVFGVPGAPKFVTRIVTQGLSRWSRIGSNV